MTFQKSSFCKRFGFSLIRSCFTESLSLTRKDRFMLYCNFFLASIEMKTSDLSCFDVSDCFMIYIYLSWHQLKAPSGYLGRHYNNLLSCDERLLKLSKEPFPTATNQCFRSNSSCQVVASDRSNTHGVTDSQFALLDKVQSHLPSLYPQETLQPFHPPSLSEYQYMDEHSNRLSAKEVMPYSGGPGVQWKKNEKAFSRDQFQHVESNYFANNQANDYQNYDSAASSSQSNYRNMHGITGSQIDLPYKSLQNWSSLHPQQAVLPFSSPSVPGNHIFANADISFSMKKNTNGRTVC
ncbi:uncharacterized protein LOC120009925 [Tripterygium wilfordii]|uniref:uncharacterized protein LOC120009925 n=1 Tax=Tripterygium wilfordii TaxID=458696 RepID=UPI0018F822FA|nr:uncharacterized protein LOC120009925 [Tripterygium wilfordii]